MRQRGWLVAIVMVLLVGGVAAWLWPGSDSGEADETAGASDARAEIVAKKRAARQKGEVDRSPCKASGRVTRERDGAPVAGALVLLSPKGFESGKPPAPGESPEPIYARTDAGGGFELTELPPGRYTLSATAAGYLPAARTDVRLAAGEPNGGLDLALAQGGHAVSGTVADVMGGPVGGAMISLVRMDEGNLISFDRAPAAAMTDDDGRFSLHVPDGMYTATAQHPDYRNDTDSFEVTGGPRTVDFELIPGGVVEGLVVSRITGAPVPAAIVTYASAEASQASGGFSVRGFGEQRVIADGQGRFRMRGLPSGVLELSAVADGHASREPTEVALGVAEQHTDVTVYVETAFEISGFVVARDGGDEGLEGVLLGAFSLQPPGLYVAKTPSESDGYFEIVGVQPGNYMIGAIGEDTLPNLTGTSAQVEDRDVTDVLVTMNPGVHVRGRVSPRGKAVVSLGVDMENMSLSGMVGAIGNAFVRGRADADGTFDLHPVAPGMVKLVAETDDGSKGELEVEVGSDGVDGVVIDLQPRASITGHVVDADGNPVTDVRVVVSRTDDDDRVFNFSMVMSNAGFGEGAPTREDGSFQVRGLDPGSYAVTVEPSKGGPLRWAGSEDAEPQPRDVQVGPEGVEGLELAVEARDGVIRGVVLDPEGAPLPDAWVTAMPENAMQQMRASQQRRFGGSNEGDEPEQLEAEVPPDEDTELREGGQDAAARSASRAWAERPVLTDGDGRFEITRLRAGTYTVQAEADRGGARVQQQGVQLGASLSLRVEPLATIAGSVTQDGRPVSRFVVVLSGASSRRKSVFDEDGAFEVARLDPGTYEVEVESDAGVATMQAEVEEGGITRIEVELESFGSVRGRVVDASTGEGIGGLAVMVVPESGSAKMMANGLSMFMGQSPRTDADGRFEVDDVPPGKGSIAFIDRDAAFSAGGSVASADYELEGGEDRDLGTVTGVAASQIPAEERGDLGLSTTVATWKRRPRAKTEDGDAPSANDGTDDGTKRLWVRSVVVDGPAHEAGIRPGDEILAVNGTSVQSPGPDVAAALLRSTHLRTGDDVSLEIEHEGSKRTVTAVAQPKKKAAK